MIVNDPAIWQTARQKLPLPMLMTVMGDGSHTKKNSECPFCGEGKGSWGIFESNGKHFFKCHKLECVGNQNDYGHNEIAYIQLRLDMNRTEAAKHFLKLAVPELVPHLFDPAPAPPRPRKPSTELGAEDDIDLGPAEHEADQAAPRPPPPPPPRDGDPQNVWHALWKKLPLTIGDRQKLKTDRGLSDETIDALGFRSNNSSNLHHLQTLANEYPMDDLVSEGIYKLDSRGVKPSGQFHGWGISGTKNPKTGKADFEQNEPIIIPYLTAAGVPFYLRPHKGGVKKPEDELADIELWEEEQPDTCASHVYCPFLLTELIHLNDGLCVLTEGEYKAAALWQCGIAAIACPGIQFVRNKAFKEELIHLLREFGVTDMVILFDNEVKDDPSIPKRYKADPWKRWDTPMWAEYTAIDLRDYFSNKGYCRIGWLPDELRVDGKADCDGILAQMVFKHGIEEGTKAARRIFMQAVDKASEKPGLDLFPTESRRIIECKLQRLFYKPNVMFGGNKEMTLARRFSEFDPETGKPVNQFMAELYRSLRGCYYERKSVREKDVDALNKERNALLELIEKLKAKSEVPNWERERRKKLRIAYAQLAAIWEQIKGLPETRSNFVLSCDFKLHTLTGDVHRLVTLKDSKERSKVKEAPIRRLSPSDLARLADFRKWCYSTGEAVFLGGDKCLQQLVLDMDHHSYLRDIHEVTTYGYHAPSKIWFFGDVAFGPDCKAIMPDASNIFWHEGIGYQIDQTSSDRGDSFAQGAPLLMAPQGSVAPQERPDVAKLFCQFSEDLFNTLGGYEGWLLMGLILSYAIAPELVRAGGHPGMWIFGKMSSGKTTVARWLMKVWGFKELGGIRIGESTTPTGMNRFLGQYSCLPVWMDEYRRLYVDAQREEVLRGAFDRSSSAKGIADHSTKTRNATILTTPIVSGESSSGDAATRSRYGHVAVSAHKRIGDGHQRYGRVQNESNHFYHIGHWLMTHRTEFRDQAMATLELWMAGAEVKSAIIIERVRLVHGVSYACLDTMSRMLGLEQSIKVPEPGDADENWERTKRHFASTRLTEFRHFLFKHGEQALQDVIEETFLSQFWRDIISGIQLGKIPRKLIVDRFVRIEPDGKLTKVDANLDDAVPVIYLAPEAVYASYQQYKASRREDAQQQLSDIRREVEKEPYWIPPPKAKDVRCHRITIGGHKSACWVLSLARAEGAGGKPGPYLFPFGEEMLDAITSDGSEDAGAGVD